MKHTSKNTSVQQYGPPKIGTLAIFDTVRFFYKFDHYLSSVVDGQCLLTQHYAFYVLGLYNCHNQTSPRLHFRFCRGSPTSRVRPPTQYRTLSGIVWCPRVTWCWSVGQLVMYCNIGSSRNYLNFTILIKTAVKYLLTSFATLTVSSCFPHGGR